MIQLYYSLKNTNRTCYSTLQRHVLRKTHCQFICKNPDSLDGCHLENGKFKGSMSMAMEFYQAVL